jgi:hypothetical protein
VHLRHRQSRLDSRVWPRIARCATASWIVEGEEEIGSTNFDEIVRRSAELLQADGALWEGGSARLPDGRPEVALGFKGAPAVRLDVRTVATDAHSSFEPIAPGAAWRASPTRCCESSAHRGSRLFYSSFTRGRRASDRDWR